MKKLNYKVLGLILVLLSCQIIIYFGTQFFIGEPHILETNFDNNLPHIPAFVVFYILWYLMLIVVPYLVYKHDSSAFYKYCIVYIISILISFIIYIVYPTTIARTLPETSGLFGKLLDIIYYLDAAALNCLPSLHASLSTLFMFSIFNIKNMSFTSKATINVLSILVILSTLFIKQHVLYDIICSVLIISTVWYLTSKLKLDLKFQKIISNSLKIKEV